MNELGFGFLRFPVKDGNEYALKPGHVWKLKLACEILAGKYGRASDRIDCGMCEANCSQKLPIWEYLKNVKEVME